MRRFVMVALVLLGSCGGGGGGGSGGAQRAELYVRNLTASETVTGAAWWPFRFQGVGEDDWNWTDWTADPLLPGEARLLAVLDLEDAGYDLAYDLNGTSGGGSIIGAYTLRARVGGAVEWTWPLRFVHRPGPSPGTPTRYERPRW